MTEATLDTGAHQATLTLPLRKVVGTRFTLGEVSEGVRVNMGHDTTSLRAGELAVFVAEKVHSVQRDSLGRVVDDGIRWMRERAPAPTLQEKARCQYCEEPRVAVGTSPGPVSLCVKHAIRHAQDFGNIRQLTINEIAEVA